MGRSYTRKEELLAKYINGIITRSELDELTLDIRENGAGQKDWEELLEMTWHQSLGEPASLSEISREQMLADLLAALPTTAGSPQPVHRTHFLQTAWFRWAAVLLLIAGTATFVYRRTGSQADIALEKSATIPAATGGNKAVLTLANGATIILDNAASGTVVNQGSTKIIKLTDGSLAYHADVASNDTGLNTITTPRGGQYQVILPDGTTAWLNAASSITFAASFRKERTVTVTGEVYLEVASMKDLPFTVEARGTMVNVLGTAFNVNAYEDEPCVKTVLIEGSVQVLNNRKTILLKPGQQCLSGNGMSLIPTNADIEQALAWKNGTFFFKHTGIADAMRQISRWCDVEVVYENGIPDIFLGGEMKRDLTLSQMVDGLREMGVSLRMEKTRLIVMNDQR